MREIVESLKQKKLNEAKEPTLDAAAKRIVTKYAKKIVKEYGDEYDPDESVVEQVDDDLLLNFEKEMKATNDWDMYILRIQDHMKRHEGGISDNELKYFHLTLLERELEKLTA